MIGGFHTPVECDVYAILARRCARIIHCLPGALPKRLSPERKALIAEGRLLLISPYAAPVRKTRETCRQSNQLALDKSQRRVVAYLHPQSSLAEALTGHRYHVL